MTELAKRLVLRYNPLNNPGQFTFRNFNNGATDEEMFELALYLNAFQEDDVHKVLAVSTFEF